MPRLSTAARAASWFLAGPTASGKSDVALALVGLLRSRGEAPEIVALDSMTLYRGMDIGTAKPTGDDRAFVRHHLFDILDVNEAYSVAQYVVAAEAICNNILSAGGVPVFVGGTGLYLRSLLRGVFEGPAADPEYRETLQRVRAAEGAGALHAMLAEVDSETAERLSPNDERRVIRALEVFNTTGRPLSGMQSQDEPDEVAKRVFWIEPDRKDLHKRINSRVDRMIAAGWQDEARAILKGETPVGPTASKALGYQELFSVLEGRAELPDAIERIKARTRQFAKRQHTWFRNLSECQAVGVSPGATPESVAQRLMAESLKSDCEDSP